MTSCTNGRSMLINRWSDGESITSEGVMPKQTRMVYDDPWRTHPRSLCKLSIYSYQFYVLSSIQESVWWRMLQTRGLHNQDSYRQTVQSSILYVFGIARKRQWCGFQGTIKMLLLGKLHSEFWPQVSALMKKAISLRRVVVYFAGIQRTLCKWAMRFIYQPSKRLRP